MLTNKELNNLPLQSVRISDLVEYLQLTGWKLTDDGNNRWLVFEGGQDAEGQPLEIVIPRNNRTPDFAIYLTNAVELLSAMSNESPQRTIRRVRLHDRDILSVRNLDTGGETSISLRLASKQIDEFKRLITFSTLSEQRPRPYFYKSNVTKTANQMTDHYRFGHTFAGSFGMTIECPIIHQDIRYKQYSLLDDDVSEVVIPPIERRVMERIIRGLTIAEEAPRNQDLQGLMEQYTRGFNANMCRAVLRMAPEQRSSIEYTIDWSPKVEPSDDIRNVDAIRLSETSYSYLDYVSKELRKLRPEPVIIRGLVESLTSKGNPRSLSADERSVIVKWTNRPEGRAVGVYMRLDKDDYIAAHQAHLDWKTVEVRGELRQVGSVWQLVNPTGFRVL